jgi:hypothetical protein
VVSLIGLPAVQERLSHSVWIIERTAGGVLMVFGGWVLWRLLEAPSERMGSHWRCPLSAIFCSDRAASPRVK